MKNTWEIVHDSDDENGNATCWVLEINNSKYGKYVWISETDNGFDVEVDRSSIVVIMNCKTLKSAKRWVSINLK